MKIAFRMSVRGKAGTYQNITFLVWGQIKGVFHYHVFDTFLEYSVLLSR